MTRDRDLKGQLVYRSWTRAGDPVQATGVSQWRRRGDAVAALAWASPVSGARCLALAAHVRGLSETALHQPRQADMPPQAGAAEGWPKVRPLRSPGG